MFVVHSDMDIEKTQKQKASIFTLILMCEIFLMRTLFILFILGKYFNKKYKSLVGTTVTLVLF